MDTVVLLAKDVERLRPIMTRHYKRYGRLDILEEGLDTLKLDLLLTHTYLLAAEHEGKIVAYIWAYETSDGMCVAEVHSIKIGGARLVYSMLRELSIKLGMKKIYGIADIEPHSYIADLAGEANPAYGHVDGQYIWDDLRPIMGR